MLDWMLLGLAAFALSGFLYQTKRSRRAMLHLSMTQAKVEAELKIERERLLSDAAKEASGLVNRGQREVDTLYKEAQLKAKEQALLARQEVERLTNERMQTLDRQGQRLQSKEDNLDKKLSQVDLKAKEVDCKIEHLKEEQEKLEVIKADTKRVLEEQVARLEIVAGLTREDAKAELVVQMEYTAKMDAAKLVRRIEDEATEEATRRARWTIGTAIQRIASDVIAEITVSSVQLPSDDLKGKIIGREGRNIRALEKALGCDLIIDDTPETIVVSSFDPIRREVARQAILKLLADGRIHPARIEEVVEKVKADMDLHLKDIGEAAAISLGFPDVHPKLHKLLGRLNYRTSYGQNVLTHSNEVARIAEYMAAEMGANQRLVRRAGLFHDIGKAIDREVDGTHIEIGIELLKRFGEKDSVINAMSCHHGDCEPKTVEAMLVTAADALSAARPGARREVLETYVKRLEVLESIANSYKGVQKSFAMQAGREIRIMVDAGQVNDDQAFWIAKDVSRRIESEMQYPGQIKVTVMRETRAVEYAR
jgi:ribonuclease Y